MSINRVKPTDWGDGYCLDRHDLTQLDKNCSYMVDKRAGQPDSINSTLILSTNGKLNCESTGSINLSDTGAFVPGAGWAVNIRTGDPIRFGAEIDGWKSPLRWGFATTDVTGLGIKYVDETLFVKSILRFSNYNLSTATVPIILFQDPYDGYYFMIVELTADSTQEIKLTNHYVNEITLQPGENCIIYIDENDAHNICDTGFDSLVQNRTYFNYDSSSTITKIDTTETNFLSLTPDGADKSYAVHNINNAQTVHNYDITYLSDLSTVEDKYPLFSNVKRGDVFEIQLTCKIAYATFATEIYLCPYVSFGTSYTINSDQTISIVDPNYSIMKTNGIMGVPYQTYVIGSQLYYFTATKDGYYLFKLFLHAKSTYNNASSVLAVNSPISFNINQFRI